MYQMLYGIKQIFSLNMYILYFYAYGHTVHTVRTAYRMIYTVRIVYRIHVYGTQL